MKDILWLQTTDTWAMEVFDFFFFPLLIGLIGIEAKIKFVIGLFGFFPAVYGWRLGWWKENSMARVFAFKKDRENGWICRKRRRIGMEETVCLQFWWSGYGEGTAEAVSSLSYDYKLCSLFLRTASLCFHCILAG